MKDTHESNRGCIGCVDTLITLGLFVIPAMLVPIAITTDTALIAWHAPGVLAWALGALYLLGAAASTGFVLAVATDRGTRSIMQQSQEWVVSLREENPEMDAEFRQGSVPGAWVDQVSEKFGQFLFRMFVGSLVASTAWCSLLLCFIHYEGAGKLTPVSCETSASTGAHALRYLTWHLADSVPVAKIPTTLNWRLPCSFTDTTSGLVLLGYKTAVAVTLAGYISRRRRIAKFILAAEGGREEDPPAGT